MFLTHPITKFYVTIMQELNFDAPYVQSVKKRKTEHPYYLQYKLPHKNETCINLHGLLTEYFVISMLFRKHMLSFINIAEIFIQCLEIPLFLRIAYFIR